MNRTYKEKSNKSVEAPKLRALEIDRPATKADVRKLGVDYDVILSYGIGGGKMNKIRLGNNRKGKNRFERKILVDTKEASALLKSITDSDGNIDKKSKEYNILFDSYGKRRKDTYYTMIQRTSPPNKENLGTGSEK